MKNIETLTLNKNEICVKHRSRAPLILLQHRKEKKKNFVRFDSESTWIRSRINIDVTFQPFLTGGWSRAIPVGVRSFFFFLFFVVEENHLKTCCFINSRGLTFAFCSNKQSKHYFKALTTVVWPAWFLSTLFQFWIQAVLTLNRLNRVENDFLIKKLDQLTSRLS